MVAPDLPIGDRIRHYRRGRRQETIAGLVGITVDYLSQIERGLKIPSVPILYALAEELGVPIAALLSDRTRAEPTPSATTEAPPIVRALMGYGPPRSASPVPAPVLRDRVEAAWRSWQTSPTRFTEADLTLPELLADTEHAARAARTGSDAEARRETLRAAADLYGLLRSYLRRCGRIDLSTLAADRALRAAEDADDPVRIAAAQWNVGHVLLAAGDADGAEEVALRGAEQLHPRTASGETDAVAMAGALRLVAATAAARRRDWSTARDRIGAALPAARQVGETNTGWTVFGPTNVRLHQVSIELEAGEASEALRQADDVNTTGLPSRERTFTFTLEIAAAYDLRREDAATLLHLLELEQLAPEDLARTPAAVTLVLRVVRRARAMHARQAEALAGRMGVL
jgi:transcriptional regulator with XRE-family HTH domain